MNQVVVRSFMSSALMDDRTGSGWFQWSLKSTRCPLSLHVVPCSWSVH